MSKTQQIVKNRLGEVKSEAGDQKSEVRAHAAIYYTPRLLASRRLKTSRVVDFRRVAALLPVCVGGAGVEMRIPGAVRATGAGTQLQGVAQGLCETRGSHRAVAD